MEKRTIIKTCGIIGISGCIAVIAADVVGIILHEKHDPISDTISMLAIGKYGWIQDIGLDLLALGYFALAAGLLLWKRKGTKWIISMIILILMSATVVLIAEHNQYAGRPGHTGHAIHRKLVFTLAGLFLFLTVLSSFDLKYLKPFLKKFSWWIAGLWLIFAPLLPLIPDNFDGAYERLICTLLVAWPIVVSYQLINNTDFAV
ncbi:DUF998 domain-containing protein [Mangrovivirga sp. M17]|uniref:DUF998 domain-containing protein n=1 Tax=Mangrovivirga halotolerans TaxID=2993936 RepID=A0ABT3RVK3_9BACT|nr:DUF998 domain-containing protein [Mangrovivirga halotolerans]MCX2745617.1 DUF998 domain-containing protein [Mangrovivirga halotolerans]